MAAGAGAGGGGGPRVILHVDLDCFYAQVEEVRAPSLRGVPMGVYQKFLLVTCNYAARAAGVPKMVPVAEARRVCPQLVLINGEDLTPYRAASLRIYQVVRGFADRVERLVLDELYVDATDLVDARVRAGPRGGPWEGHVLGATGDPTDETERLRVGAAVLAEIRRAVYAQAGYTCSGGVATCKLLAKLASALHKPNQQTVLLPAAVPALLPPLPVHKLTGVGYRLATDLRTRLQVETVAQLQRFPQAYLVEVFGERAGAFLYAAARGDDPTPVVTTGAPKTVSEEDSFMACRTIVDAQRRLEDLARGLLVRLDDDADAFARHPTQLRLGVRVADTSSSSSSSSSADLGAAAVAHFVRETKSVPLPLDCLDRRVGVPERARVLAADTLVPLLRRMLGARTASPFNLTLLNVGVTQFVDTAAPTTTIRSFFGTPQAAAASSVPSAHPSTAHSTLYSSAATAVASASATAWQNRANWDPEVLAALPTEVRAELDAAAAPDEREATSPSGPTRAPTAILTGTAGRLPLDAAVWAALPADVQAEVRSSGLYDIGPAPTAAVGPVRRSPAGKPSLRRAGADLRAWVVRPTL
jgi:DNA polymerase iota